jgi:cytochrome b561
MKVTTGYSGAQIALHWLIAAGVVVNYVVSEGMGRALKQKLEGAEITVSIAPLHVWLGVAILVLAALRILLRLTRGGPAAEPGAGGKAASALHGLLYLLMLGVPLGGGLAWFAGLTALAEPHALFANVLIVLAGLHAVMGLVHHYVLKDTILLRMLRPQ